MNDPNGRTESQFERALADGECILRNVYPASHHRIDVHMEISILGEELQLLVEHFQTFLRDLVRIHVINRNLQPLQASAVQPLDSLRDQQVAICNHPGNDAVLANACDDLVQLRMQQRLTANDSDDCSSQVPALVDALENDP